MNTPDNTTISSTFTSTSAVSSNAPPSVSARPRTLAEKLALITAGAGASVAALGGLPGAADAAVVAAHGIPSGTLGGNFPIFPPLSDGSTFWDVDGDGLTAQAHYGLAQAAYRRRDWEAAARSATTAAGQHFHYAPAHYLAGHALWKLRRADEAEAALQRAIAINPVYPAAHRALATFYLKEQADWSAHVRHRLLAREARQRVTRQQAPETPEELHPQEFRAQFGSGGSGGGGETFEEAPGAAPAPELPPLAETVVVVTGLPRSGTSMMMQMLLAGGIHVMADDHRPADASNERGYLEHDLARKLGKDAGWIGEAKGKAVKIVAQLLPHLPHQHRYRFIMMHRPLEEIVASQKKMLQRLGKDGAAISDEALMRTFQSQVARVRTMLMHLRRRGILDVLDVKYHEALRDPRGTAERIAAFLGDGESARFNPTAAQSAVAPELRHERGARSITT